MEETIYRLHPLSPLHLGEGGYGMEAAGEAVHSDTLFSALCSSLRLVEGQGWLEDLLAAFNGGPAPFLLSSAFPWAGELRFYPRPMVRPARAGSETEGGDPEAGKRLKRVGYVSEGLFRSMLVGGPTAGPEEGDILPGGLWLSAAERAALPGGLERVWEKPDPVARVALDRASNSSSLYHVGEVSYREGCGLWFAVRWRESGWRDPFEAALWALGEGGIGGERSSGRGQFRPERWEGAGVPAMEAGAGRAVTLSLYHPTRAEVGSGLLDGASYRFLSRRGWLASPEGQGLRSRAVRMVAEGSVIGGAPQAGDLADVTPEGFRSHRAYRYGLAFPASLGGN